ncbi:MAG: metallophosphoesterase [Treponema sp.]|jgi:UDP-2,3-diacylglucosamine pyrophosphatase LpxH|nr:metallophosphoesterase [Treponema sp.]
MNKVKNRETLIRLPGLEKPFTIVHITDAHISCDDAADRAFLQYSERMKQAYSPGTVKHCLSGEPCAPLDCFRDILSAAGEAKADLLVLTGDIINYPSAAAVAKVAGMLEDSGIPWVYTAGNHDWHYEGMKGSEESLRSLWIEKRLKPFYKDADPLCSAFTINGVSILLIDSSSYQINGKQLGFYRETAALKQPLFVFTHIPLYMPSMPPDELCCGHPDWGAAADKNWRIERRERWPETGNRPETKALINLLPETENLRAVFAGHLHRDQVLHYAGKTQYITAMAANGQYRTLRFSG